AALSSCGGGAAFLHAVASMTAAAAKVKHVRRVARMEGLLARSGARNAERLSRMDEIGVLDLVLVRLVDLAPLLGVAVHPLGDLRQTIALHHRVGLVRGRRRRRGAAPAFDIGKIGLR